MEWCPSITKTFFATPAFPVQGLSAMLVSPGKGLCRHHRFARALARCHCKQRVPGRLIGHYVRSFRLINNGFLIIKYLWFVNFKYIFKNRIIKLRKIVLSTDSHLFRCQSARTWYGKIYHVHCITSTSLWYTLIHGIMELNFFDIFFYQVQTWHFTSFRIFRYIIHLQRIHQDHESGQSSRGLACHCQSHRAVLPGVEGTGHFFSVLDKNCLASLAK